MKLLTRDFIFPVLMKNTEHHGLESTAEAGVDYWEYRIAYTPKDFPINFSFKIVAIRVWV
jgi:hypothetical protein